MSVLRKIPFIEGKIKSLSAQQLSALSNVMNNYSTPTFYSLTNGSLSEYLSGKTYAIEGVLLQLDETNTKTGILIYTSEICVFIAYHKYQDMIIYNVDLTTETYKKINEYLDINELRRIVENLEVERGDVELNPEMLVEVMEGSDTIIVDVNQTDDKVQIKIDEEVKEFIVPKEVSLSDFEHEVSTDHTNIIISPGVMESDNAYDISLEIEGTGVHYGVAFVVFPYNGSQCITTSWLTINNTTKECFATMDSDGQVNLTIPYAMNPASEDTHIFVKRRF